jgi:hypothetical protein
MFLLRLLKRLIYLAIFGSILYASSGYVKIHGKPARQYADEFFASTLWKEGSKDLRTWLGAVLRFAGDKVEEGISVNDEAKLKEIIEGDLRQQVEQVKNDH